MFIWAPEEEDPWRPSAASRWWLHQSLANSQSTFEALGSRLILRRGPTLETLEQLIAETGATAVFWNRRYEAAVVERDSRLKSALREQGVDAESFGSALLFEPWTIRNKRTDGPFQVFSAFWKACLRQPAPATPLDVPTQLQAPGAWPASVPLCDFQLEPRVDWVGGLRAAWMPGEEGAAAALRLFVHTALPDYVSGRDRPAEAGTSRLSPHLHFGEISPRAVWSTIQKMNGPGTSAPPRSLSKRTRTARICPSSSVPFSTDCKPAITSRV